MKLVIALLAFSCWATLVHAQSSTGANAAPSVAAEGKSAIVRVAAAQPRNRTIDWQITEPAEVLRLVDQALGNLEQLILTSVPTKL